MLARQRVLRYVRFPLSPLQCGSSRMFGSSPPKGDKLPPLMGKVKIFGNSKNSPFRELFLLRCIHPSLLMNMVSKGSAQLTELCDQEVQIGMPVEIVTRKIRTDMDEHGIIEHGQSPPQGDKLRPVLEKAILDCIICSQSTQLPIINSLEHSFSIFLTYLKLKG